MTVKATTDSNKQFTPYDDPFLRLSAYLNQIKQDYITARFLLILSRYKGLDLDFVDRNVTIINTLDYSVHNIYVELLKKSFKSFYDILDKIACFINDYLKLQMKIRDVTFRNIWYNKNNNQIKAKIKDTKNKSLNALFDIYGDIHKDFNSTSCINLRKTRHALTHRFLNVKEFQESEDTENMKEGTLVQRTLEIGQIVRNAIIYLLTFVDIEESKKEEEQGSLPTLFADVIPDDLKSFR